MFNPFKKTHTLVVHNGTFHADDLFACAIMSIWFKKKDNLQYKIIRTRNPEIINKADYVFDVGGIYNETIKRFDHHQKEGAGMRTNGIPYASCGLAWKHFGLDICEGNQEIWNFLDNKIFTSVDAMDNGVDIMSPKFENVLPYCAEQVFLSHSPTWNENDVDEDSVFIELVAQISTLIKREIQVAFSNYKGKQIILDAYNNTTNKKIVIVEHDFPRYLFQSILSLFPEPLFFIYPSAHGPTWKIESIRKTPATFESRVLFPESWRGLLNSDPKLIELTGIPEAIFCHRGGFYMNAKSKEGALKLAQLALDNKD